MQGFASIICVEAISSPWRIFLQCFEDIAVLEELNSDYFIYNVVWLF